MKQRLVWLLALSSCLIIGMSIPAFAASSSGSVELRGIITDVEDNTARANEYVTTREDDGATLSPKMDLKVVDGKSAFDMSADLKSADNFSLEVDFDLNRIFKFGTSLDAFQHWKDKETLEQLGATMQGDIDGDQPRVSTNLTGSLNTAYPSLDEANAQYFEEQSNDYLVTRREWTSEAELHLPELPNIVFHAGQRVETRNGMEQSITLSKCSSCHIEAEGKDIDERTEDLSFGMTGKFGLVTIDYEYLNRKFEDESSIEEYNYLFAGKTRADVVDRTQLLYDGVQEYSNTPDSDKDSHMLKARVDLSSNTVFTGSFVQADIESQKQDVLDEGGDGTPTYQFVGSDTLETEYTGYTGKFATRLGPVRLSASANIYEIEGPEYTLDFPDRDVIDVDPYLNPQTYHSAESREAMELGLDAVYRISMGTTLRLGYDYEEIEREEEELGTTETHSVKAAINSRLAKGLSLRGSYEYQDIEEPFYLEDGTGIAQNYDDGTIQATEAGDGVYVLNTADFTNIDNNTNTVYYWNSVYGSRTMDATNQPDEVHELKGSVNWSPAANMAATISARVRMEENGSVQYEQTSYVPGFSFWYAPNGKMNLTMAYTFNKQETENNMCVGWYHG